MGRKRKCRKERERANRLRIAAEKAEQERSVVEVAGVAEAERIATEEAEQERSAAEVAAAAEAERIATEKAEQEDPKIGATRFMLWVTLRWEEFFSLGGQSSDAASKGTYSCQSSLTESNQKKSTPAAAEPTLNTLGCIILPGPGL